MFEVDLINMYDAQSLIKDPENDLDVLEILADNMEYIEAQARLADISYARYQYVSDDTTHVYVDNLITAAESIVKVFSPLCDDFLGIDDDARKKGEALLNQYNLAYAVLLYRTGSYYIVAEELANGSSDLTGVTLPPELLEAVNEDQAKVLKITETIIRVFQDTKVFFAEYQITDPEAYNEIQAYLETRNGLNNSSDSAIAELSADEVKRILRTIGQ